MRATVGGRGASAVTPWARGLSPCRDRAVARPVQPRAASPASRVIVRAVRGGRARLALLPPLVLHPDGEGKHTEAAEAILRGTAPLGWD